MSKKFLIVDDSMVSRMMVKAIVIDALPDASIIEAGTGEAALKLVEDVDQLDYALIDFNMPGMDGLCLLKAVRADENLSSMPVLMVTAEAKREQIVVAAEAGVNGYVVKPFTAITLKEKIDKIFDRLQA